MVDHAPDVEVAPNQAGVLSAYKPDILIPPTSAISNKGIDAVDLVSDDDNNGFPAYEGDTLTLTYAGINKSNPVILVLKVAGFISGEGEEKPYSSSPAIVVETKNANGVWTERGRLNPRFAYSVGAFNISPYVNNGSNQIRLRSISHSVKYHAIDYAAIYNKVKPAFTSVQVSPTKALFGSSSILTALKTVDQNYVKLSSGEKFSLGFPVKPLKTGFVREFIFISKGYYIPKSGTYLVYTWDGKNWIERDAYTYPGSYTTKAFDLSLFLPDPDGEYKIRVWQDYEYEPAAINYVKMEVGASQSTLLSGWDYRTSSDITNIVKASDGLADYWSGCPRNRITQYKFQPIEENIPPTTNPVSVTNLSSPTPTIAWTYNDAESDPQGQYEVQVWTGSSGTGTIMWNPPVGTGTGTSVIYAGSALTPGVTYYAMVRANDGSDWGQWSETSFVLSAEKICGDLNGDGKVDAVDAKMLTSRYKVCNGNANFLEEADYDGDGCITFNDYREWYKCYQTFIKK